MRPRHIRALHTSHAPLARRARRALHDRIAHQRGGAVRAARSRGGRQVRGELEERGGHGEERGELKWVELPQRQLRCGRIILCECGHNYY